MDTQTALLTMEQAALRAGAELLTLQPGTVRLAARKDFLTDADLTSETMILQTLDEAFPDVPAWSEEQGGEKRIKGYQWIIDPIDGTVNFFLQDDMWAVSIALALDGRTIAGVVYLPAKKLLFSATNESHATILSIESGVRQKVHVNDESSIKDSQFWWDWGKEESGGADHAKVYDLIRKLDQASIYPQNRNSAAADAMMVALGRISGYVFLKPDPFDVAAAGLIIGQAGGRVTDVTGAPWNAFSTSFIATNGAVHDALLKLVNE